MQDSKATPSTLIDSSEMLPAGSVQGMLHKQLVSDSGATCIVYKVQIDGQWFIRKELRPELLDKAIYRDAFRKEYEVGSTLHNQYVVASRDFVDERDECYLLQDYVNGLTLQQLLHTDPSYFQSKDNLVKFLTQLLQGLSHMHEHQVVHLDLKPSNIMLTQVGHDVRIIDLGFSYNDAFDSTMGLTLKYAAPELKEKGTGVDARVDIYGVGTLLQYIHKHTKGGLPKSLQHKMECCLQTDPAQRYPSAQAMLLELQSHGGHKARIVSLLLIVALLCALFAWLKWHGASSSDAPSKGTLAGDTLSKDTIHPHGFYFVVTSEQPATVELCNVDKERIGGDMMLDREVEHNNKQYRLTSLAHSALYGCYRLTNIYIPPSVTYIGSNQFLSDTLLSSIVLSDSVKHLGRRSFSDCHNLKEIKLSNGLDKIEDGMFVNCYELNHVKVPSSVRTIEMDAFVSCTKLTDITLSDSLQTLERGVFYNCTALESITLPASLKNIGEYTFMQCPQLRSVTNLAENPQPYYAIFDHNFKGTIYVPAASLQRYREAPGWSELNIQPIPRQR